MKKEKLFFYILFLLVVSIARAQGDKRPNVVVIYTDDHRYTGVHALGGQAISTPNIDQLAYEGITFTKTYLMGSFVGATCIPSRAMLLTGRNLFELDGTGRTIPRDHTTIGEAFSKAGYHAHREGKWHQDFKSLGRGFDSGGLMMGKPVYLTDHFRMPFSEWNKQGNYPKDKAFLLSKAEDGSYIRRLVTKADKPGPTGTEADGPHSSEVIADGTIDFINSYNENKPFFMYVAFHAPHDPRQAPQKYKDMYPEDQIQLPPSYMSQHPFDNGHIFLRDEQLAPWPRTEQVVKKHLSDYYAIISHLDAQIGRVIETLKEGGLYENTIIVLAGDSGLAVGNHGLMGKQNIYDEDGIHIPFIISGGQVERKHKGKRIDALSYIHDIMPTICDLADIKIPKTTTGKSLKPVINGEKNQVRDHTFHVYRQHQRAYRKGNYKLIEYVRTPVKKDYARSAHIAGSRVTQLFNTSKDPWETYNLADFPEYEQTVSELRNAMRTEAQELGDVADGERTEVDFWEYFN